MTAYPGKILPSKPGIIFMGTPEFSLPVLRILIENDYNVTSVVTQPDRPKGRGRKMAVSPVKRLALENNIQTLQPERVSETGFIETIKKQVPDLIVVVAFGQIITKDLLMVPKSGVINIHASLLPKYRGAAPIQHAVLNNEAITGLTVMQMDEGLDTGPVLYQEKVPIKKDETAGQLRDRLSIKSGELIIKFLNIMSGRPIKGVPQDHSAATYAPKIDKKMSMVPWEHDAEKVSAHIRALDPVPGAWTALDNTRIKLYSSRVSDNKRSGTTPGRVIRENRRGLKVETGKGVVEIGEVQYPGKKRLPAVDFLKGFDLPEGMLLGEKQEQ